MRDDSDLIHLIHLLVITVSVFSILFGRSLQLAKSRYFGQLQSLLAK